MLYWLAGMKFYYHTASEDEAVSDIYHIDGVKQGYCIILKGGPMSSVFTEVDL